MSSRGSVAKNGHVTTDEYEFVYDGNGNLLSFFGAKVLKGKKNNHSLPDFAHTPGSIYVKLNPDGSFRELRVYDENRFPVIEIAYHPEHSLTGKWKEPVLHYHLFDSNLNRKMGGILSAHHNREIYYQYKKYLEAFGL